MVKFCRAINAKEFEQKSNETTHLSEEEKLAEKRKEKSQNGS